MRVFLVIVALAALVFNSEAQNLTQPNVTAPNGNQSPLDRPQWNIPAFNGSQWNIPAFNRTQKPSSFNRTQLLNQIVGKNQQQALNRTQWTNQFYDRINLQAKNRTNSRFQLLNNSLSNVSSRNRSRWNGHSRPRRSEPVWVVPENNQTTQNDHVIVDQAQNFTQSNRPQWNIPTFNGTHWDIPAFNRTQTDPSINKTQLLNQLFNRTQKNPSSFNRTQLINQIVGKNQQLAQNRTQWMNQFYDRINVQAKNRTNSRLQLLNDSLSNLSSRNKSRWNDHSRPRRSDPKWLVPPSNHTWNQTTHNGDIIVGQIGYLDRLLFNQTYRKESRWWSGREKSIEYPKDLGKWGVNRQETITAIRVYNKFLDGLHSSAKISSGGVGYRYVKIKLSSPWNKGFEYTVQIFGR